MKKYFYIGVFGALGAVSRLAIKNINLSLFFQHFPMNTLIINLTGSFVFALVITIAYEAGKINHNLRLGITAGFLGAYTTFSTFCRDTITALQGGRYTDAAAYVVLSVVFGLALTHGGTIIAKAYIMKLIRKLKSLYLAASDITSNGAGE
jgi:CrcB protein